MEDNTIIIDGSILEGGGQIIRTSLTCSSIFKIPLTIENVRGKRSKPGLQNQHLASVRLITEVCYAQVNGDSLKSSFLNFKPKMINHGNFNVDAKTAGSICLIIQSIVPTLIFAKERSRLTIQGGTDVEFAPTIDYYKSLVQFYMGKMGINVSINLIKRGFYPRGGGCVTVDIEPINEGIEPINITERGEITRITADCFVAGTLPISIAQQMSNSIEKTIKSNGKYRHINFSVNVYKETPNRANGNGSGCLLLVETSFGCKFGFNTIGKRDYTGTDMGTNIGHQFLDFFENSNACFDVQMQDQILIFMALAKGNSKVKCSELSLHSQTCIHILEKMIGVKFLIEQVQKSKDVIISCDGLGISNKDI